MKRLKNKMKQMHMMMSTYFLLIMLITVILLSSFYYRSATQLLYDDTKAQTTEALKQSSEYIAEYLDKIKGLAELIAMNPDTLSFLEGEHTEVDLNTLLSLALNTDERIVSIAVVSKQGQVVDVGEQMFMETSDDMMDEAWYMEAKNSHQMPALNITREASLDMNKKAWVVSISREIISDTGDHLGVLLLDLDYAFFEDYFKSIPLGSGHAFILDLSGDVIYHPNDIYFQSTDKANELVVLCEAGEGYETDNGLLSFKTTITNSNWILVGLSSLDQVEAFRSKMILTVLVTSIFVIVLGIFGVYIISKKTTSPLIKLQKAMSQVDLEKKAIEMPKKGSSEVQQLTLQYNKMINEIMTLMNRVKNDERKLKDFELLALQSQINPHFLYNTLDTIVWLAEFEDYNAVIDVTKSLADMLRLALRKDDGIVTLEEEINHVKAYLNIQKQRYADILNYEFDVKSEHLEIKVPKLIIQPLVENAIYHGIRTLDRSGSVKIYTEIINEQVVIKVDDDGEGFDTLMKEKKNVKLGGVGLYNVDQRLKLVYGEDHGLSISSQVNVGTSVTIRLKEDFNNHISSK